MATLTILDLPGRDFSEVEVYIDQERHTDFFTLWVNLDGLCRLRVCRIAATKLRVILPPNLPTDK